MCPDGAAFPKPGRAAIAEVAAEGKTTDENGTEATSVAPEPTEEDRLYEALHEVDSWAVVVRLLHQELGLTKSELARGAGVVPETISRWLEEDREAEIRATRGLDELRYAVLALLRHGGMRKRLLRFWLTARNIDLGTDPLSAIADGRLEEVVTVGREFARGRRLK